MEIPLEVDLDWSTKLEEVVSSSAIVFLNPTATQEYPVSYTRRVNVEMLGSVPELALYEQPTSKAPTTLS